MSEEQEPPGRLRLTAYAVEQVALVAPLVLLLVAIVVGGVLAAIWVGVPCAVVAVRGLRAVASRQRGVAGRVLGVTLPPPYLHPPSDGLLVRLRTLVSDPMTWRDLVWSLWAVTLGFALSLLVPLLLLGVVTGWFWWFGAGPLMTMRARVDQALLAPGSTERLERRVAALTRSRAAAVDHSAAELRRLERDLHDGAQARLVAVSISLGLAEAQLDDDPAAARRTVAEARTATQAALADLRSVVRGIHPPVLADRGLDGAVRALALDMAVPVEVDGALPGRAPAPVESAVYFAVAECLTNTARHAAASAAWVDLEHGDRLLRVVVGDDGRGGASPAAGTGMQGVARRLAAFDGTMSVSSPVGGPTVVTLEVPCDLVPSPTSVAPASSSPRTTPSCEPA
ncbi:sensor domain-containing protein [Nocardioides flavescens]|uniref:sensor domain-containing protein n=1 Tax=Nocardioides flavescens TaxID=2691959 RepID=UPI0019272A20